MVTSKPNPPISESPEELPPEEAEHLQKLQILLTNFVLHLIQAFLRTGYYTPEHPESKKAKEGLYQQFKNLFKEDDELTFLVREEQEGQNILIEGLLPEPQRLSRMMLKGMGEIYVPRFAKYLERKDLVSLTLKSRMSQEEFTRFIDVMSEPSLADTRRRETKERFAETLEHHGIYNISFVYNEELLGWEREMPWRARVTLSRMKKDLRMIPFFQKMSGQELLQLRKDLLGDMVRPLRQSDLIYAVLRNTDLAATPEHPEEVIEDEFVSLLRIPYLLGTARVVLRQHLSRKELPEQDVSVGKQERLAKKVALRLKAIGTKEAENMLEEFFRLNVVSLDDLSEALKDKVVLERLTDKFLGYTDQFFEQLDQAKEKERFLTVAFSFVKMIPELIRRERYSEILRIVETLKLHFHRRMMWALLAGQILEEIGRGPIPQMLEEKFLMGKKEVRAAIIPIFIGLETGAIPHLLNILKKSDDQWVRKNACEALIQIGPVAAVHLLKELETQQLSVETTCDILKVLGEIKSEQWKTALMKILRMYLSHEDPQLRAQAIHTLCQTGGKEGEKVFLASLDDPDLEVRKRAVWCLGMIKSSKSIGEMMEILREISAAPSPQTEQLEEQIYHAFGMMGNVAFEGGTLEQVLLNVLEKRGRRQWWGLLEKSPLSDSSLGAILDALGKIGTERSIKTLNKLAKSREGPWGARVREALKKIQGRANSEKP